MENLIEVKSVYIDRFSNYVEVRLKDGSTVEYYAPIITIEVKP